MFHFFYTFSLFLNDSFSFAVFNDAVVKGIEDKRTVVLDVELIGNCKDLMVATIEFGSVKLIVVAGDVVVLDNVVVKLSDVELTVELEVNFVGKDTELVVDTVIFGWVKFMTIVVVSAVMLNDIVIRGERKI